MRRICLALLLLMFFVLPACALEFVTETVDEGSMQGEKTSLVFDSEGNPHISFLGDNQYSLKYAWFDGTDWIVQTIDTSNYGDRFANATSIALDQSGNPHISYFLGCDYRDLKYAWFDGTDWHTETVDSEGDVGKHSSIAIDSQGNPHIGYHTDDETNDLKYAQKLNGHWIIETVISGEINCAHSSMVLDGNDNPHFSYKYGCWENSNLYYVYYDGTDWVEPQEVDSGDHTGFDSSITLDGNGTPHISYFDSSYDDLKFAFLSGDQWVTSTVDSDGYTGESSSIKVDSDGYVHISYFDSSYDDLKYAFYDGNEWTLTTIDSEGYVGQDTSLALDLSGNPSISYYDSSNEDLKYASFDGQEWNVQTVPMAGGPRGYYPDMVLDSAENPHMVYTSRTYYYGDDDDDDDSPVFYAYHDGTEWQKEVIAMGDSYSYGASLAMDDNDVPHVLFGDSYYSPETGSNSELRYGVLSNGSWEFETVAFGDSYTSLAVEGNGTPHISFVGRTIMDPAELGSSASYSDILCYGVKNEDSWNITSVDNANGEFRQNTIALDSDNNPHICYLNYDYYDSEYQLKYAVDLSGSWDIQTIVSDIRVEAIDLAIDETGIPHIALTKSIDYLEDKSLKPSDSGNYELAYATLIDDEWVMESVDTIGYFRGGKISIALDSDNNPHITYRWVSGDLRKGDIGETGETELKYAYHDGSSWHTAVLETGTMSEFGIYSSLALDSGNVPHIVYFTGTGVDYGTVEGTGLSSSGGNCGVAFFTPSLLLLLLPLVGLMKKSN